MSRLVWFAALLALATGCGGPPPPTLAQQVAVIDARTPAAQRGWWHYLAGARAEAQAAFAEDSTDPLAALGRARLAEDALDDRRALARAAAAASGDGIIAAIGQAWAARAAKRLRDGDSLAQEALGAHARTRLTAHRHTVRVSFLPWLHLPRLHAHPPRIEGDRLIALGKPWALKEKRPKADADGIITTTWSLPAGIAHLELRVAGPLIAWRDGAVVAATPFDRHGPSTVRFSAPGQGPLIVAWAAARHPTLWQHRLPVPPSDDRAGPAMPERGPGVDWVWRYLHAELAILDGDAEAARAALEDAPQTPAFMALRARLAEVTPGLPTSTARDRARAAWRAVVDFAPARAHLALARLAWRAQDITAARGHLDAVLARAPDAFFAHRTSARIDLSEGRIDAARRALDAARRAAANPCSLLADQAALADARQSPDQALIAAYQRCGRPLDAALRLLDRSRPAAALTLLDGLAERTRKTTRARTLRARALIGLGRLPEARAVLSTLKDAASTLSAADLAFAQGADNAQATLKALAKAHPTASPVLELFVAQPELSPFAPLVLDTEAAIAAWEKQPPQSGPAVRVLDHSASIYYPSGKSLRWVHEVIAVRSRDAAERFGEIGLPGDVRLVALYTRKFDGRRLFAEEVAEKESVTLPDLESGDFVVAAYLETGDNGYLYDSGFLTRRVFFRGVDLPIFHQRFEVYGPKRPTVHRLSGAPAPVEVELAGRPGVRIDTHRVPLMPPVTDPPPAALWLPSARAGDAVVLADDLDYLRDRVLKRRRRTAAFDAWVRQKAGAPDARRLNRLVRAIREHVEDVDGLAETDVTEAITRGAGNRALVLSAALDVLGVRHRLLTARRRVHVPSGPFLTAADFAYPLIELSDGRFIDPGPERAPFGFVPFTISGGDALVAWPPEAGVRPVALPERRAVPDRRVVELDLHWKADGTLTGSVVDRLEGQEAIVIGHHLARLDPTQRPRLVERLLVGVVGAAQVTDLDDPAAQDPDGPLTLRYRFTAKPGDALALGLFPAQPGRSYATQAQRPIPLAIDLPTDQVVLLSLTSDRPFKGAPRAGALHSGAHRFDLVAEQDDDSLEVTAHLRIPGGLIPPGAYPDFRTWAIAVDAAERIRLSIDERL